MIKQDTNSIIPGVDLTCLASRLTDLLKSRDAR